MGSDLTRRSALAAGLAATTGVVVGPAHADRLSGRDARPGSLHTTLVPSPTLGEEIACTVYLPAGYRQSRQRYPVVYLLHGRGDTMEAWTRVKDDLDQMVGARTIPPVVAVMPDAPWSDGGSYYVDSAYTGEPLGRPVETALTVDLVRHVDRTYRTVATRTSRVVGGYSMGAAGALRYVLTRPDLFSGALVLSPAVYTPLPPADSSTREFGAYGRGDEPFVDEVYGQLNYPHALERFEAGQEVRIWASVGDDEWPNPLPQDHTHDLDFETAVLYNRAKRVEGVHAQLRVLDGGHDWDVWVPSFRAGLPYVLGVTGAGEP